MATLDNVDAGLARDITWIQNQAQLRAGATFVINTGYRPYDEQVSIFLDRFTTQFLPGRPSSIWNGKWYYLKPGESLAAVPGTSDHGKNPATAVDLGCGPQYNGLRIMLIQQAGCCTPVVGEPWHIKRRADAAQPIDTPPVVKDTDPMDTLPYIITPCPTGGFWELKKSDGGVGAQNGAPFFGSLPGVKAQVVSPLTALAPCMKYRRNPQTGETDLTVIGYWVTDMNGNVYAFGEAPFYTSYGLHPEWHSPTRKIAGIVQTAGWEVGARVRYSQIGIEAGDADYVVDTYDIGPEMKAQ